MNQQFDFLVENMTKEQASELWDRIVAYVESLELSMSGYSVTEKEPEAEDGQA